jgi:hypothetical protein
MKPSERRLIAILAVLAALCGGAILTQRLLRMQHALDRRAQTLELRQMETQALMAESALWQQRLAWLNSSQPPLESENQASEELLEALLASASEHRLQVQKKQLHEPVNGEHHREIAVTLTVKGALPSVFRWLHKVQSPDAFCAVPQMKIMPDGADPSLVVATLRFSRLHTQAAQEVTKS